jgi:lipopolysaccharide/colanic/teichoic acid biosynthesis glycosyltransferase
MVPESVTVDDVTASKGLKEDRNHRLERRDAPAGRGPQGRNVDLCPDAGGCMITGNRTMRFLKRAEDLIIGVILLIAFAPAMALIALAIKLDSAGPVIYRQRRHGQHGQPFWLYKFRSMVADADEGRHRAAAQVWIKSHQPMDGSRRMFKLANDDRVTRVGRWIRSTNLDELPQLWNVLSGNMSLVGPRPPVPYEYAEYQRHHRERMLSKPGITGLWQVSGHHRVSFEEMVLLDIRYINNWSVWMDFRIMAKTVPLLLFRRGV